jgi:hypothetical protein
MAEGFVMGFVLAGVVSVGGLPTVPDAPGRQQ